MRKARPGSWLQAALLCGTTILLYGLLFLLLPRLCPRFYPQSNEASALLLIPLSLLSTAGVLLYELKLWHWMGSDLLLGLMLLLYDGKGLYGIGLRGVLLDGAVPRYSKALALGMILGLLLLMLLLQSLSFLLKRLLQRKKA